MWRQLMLTSSGREEYATFFDGFGNDLQLELARDFLIVREFHEEGAASPGDRGQSRFEVEHFRHRDLGIENPHIRLC